MSFTDLLIIALGALAAGMATFGLRASERRYLIAAFALHVVCSFAQSWLQGTYYGRSADAFGYLLFGEAIAKLLDYDFPRFSLEVLRLAFHLDTTLPFPVSGEGSSTGTMAAVAGFITFVTNPSLLTLFLVTTWLSWFGQICWYRVAREELPEREHGVALFAFSFMPSVVFWGSAFMKEAIAMFGLGVLGISTYRFLRNGRAWFVVGIIGGVAVVGTIKAYIMFPFVLAVSAFIYTHRVASSGSPRAVRPLYLIFASLLALGGVAVIGSVFPEYSAGNLSQSVSTQQGAWDEGAGGSSIERVGGESTGALEQVALVPLALVNSLFRPTLIEVKNGPSFGAALETTGVALGILLLLKSRNLVWRTLTASPLFAASAVFIGVFAVAVGLTTSNLGSLSRYRVPMMPFCALLLLVLLRRQREERRAAWEARKPLRTMRGRAA